MFAVHVPVIALALVPALVHWPLVMMPVNIMLLELLIDPACSVVFEAEPAAADLMQRPPRDPPATRRWPGATSSTASCRALAGLCCWLGYGWLLGHDGDMAQARTALVHGLAGRRIRADPRQSPARPLAA